MIDELPWDSQFFGVRIGSYTGQKLNGEEFLKAVKDGRFECVYVFVDPSDNTGMELARRNRFHLVDTRVLYQLHLATYRVDPRNSVELLDPKNAIDVARVREISCDLATVSRFYADPRFRHRAKEMYGVWFEKMLEDPDSAIAIRRVDGVIAGFIACTIKNGNAELVLVAMAKEYQGQGIGSKLMDAVNLHLLSRGVLGIYVKTQLRNLSANQHYQRIGFRSSAVTHVYHAWVQDF